MNNCILFKDIHIHYILASELMSDGGPAISFALNLHAWNSEPDVRPFFYPHFGPVSSGYSLNEASLWNHQLDFINQVVSHHGINRIEPITGNGGRSFADKMLKIDTRQLTFVLCYVI